MLRLMLYEPLRSIDTLSGAGQLGDPAVVALASHHPARPVNFLRLPLTPTSAVSRVPITRIRAAGAGGNRGHCETFPASRAKVILGGRQVVDHDGRRDLLDRTRQVGVPRARRGSHLRRTAFAAAAGVNL